MASYSAEATVKAQLYSKNVISASLEIIQLFSTASNGNLLSSVVAFDLFHVDTFWNSTENNDAQAYDR
jgi:hypothetical protein